MHYSTLNCQKSISYIIEEALFCGLKIKSILISSVWEWISESVSILYVIFIVMKYQVLSGLAAPH